MVLWLYYCTRSGHFSVMTQSEEHWHGAKEGEVSGVIHLSHRVQP